MSKMTLCFVVAAASVLLTAVHGFYLPGVAPHSFAKDEEVELKVNKLSSVHTQLPYDYYSLKFCKPKGGVKPYSENLGEFLRGDRIENSAYDIAMLQEDFCTVLCQTQLSTKDVTDFKNAIKRQYHHNWIIDNLPAASILDTDQFVTTQYVGFPVGYQDGNSYYLYNHVNIILEVLLLSTSLTFILLSPPTHSSSPSGPLLHAATCSTTRWRRTATASWASMSSPYPSSTHSPGRCSHAATVVCLQSSSSRSPVDPIPVCVRGVAVGSGTATATRRP